MKLGLFLWPLVLAFAIVLPNRMPLEQLYRTGGLLFYANAFDEITYLSYEGSLVKQSPLRLAEYLVAALHRAGLSAGWINLLLDLVAVLGLLYFVRAALKTLKVSEPDSALGALLIISVPVLFGYSNPYWAGIFDDSIRRGWVYWVSMPQAFYPPYYRSPEPQLSWFVVAVAALFALRRRSLVPLYAVLPFLYVFVSIPLSLFLVSCSAHRLLSNRSKPAIPIPLVAATTAFTVVSVPLWICYRLFFADSTWAEFLPQTRLPMISTTSVIAMLVYGSTFPLLRGASRIILGYLALAPMLALNTQLLTGFIMQPDNFEQYFGTVAIAVIVAWAVLETATRKKWIKIVALTCGVALLYQFSQAVFGFNNYPLITSRPPPGLLNALKSNSGNVLIPDPHLASLLSMVYPRQPLTALSSVQAYESLADKHIQQYICLKQRLAADPALNAQFSSALQELDKGYAHLSSDFVLHHVYRKTQFKTFYETEPLSQDCSRETYHYYPAVTEEQPISGLYRLSENVETRPPATSVADSTGLSVETSEKPWEFAVVIAPALPTELLPQGPVVVKVAARVAQGCIAIGLYDVNAARYDQEEQRTAESPGQVTLVLASPRFSPTRRLIVRNCSPRGKSRVTLASIEGFSWNPEKLVGVLLPIR